MVFGVFAAGNWADVRAQGGWLEKVPFLKSEVSGSAQAAKPDAAPKGGLRGGLEGKTALLRVLDKQTNRVQTVPGSVGGTLPGVPAKVAIGRCVKSIGGVPGQDAAWLVIGPMQGEDVWFEGWMFNTYPDVATLDHPRYDVQLVACDKNADEAVAPVLPVIKVEEPVVGKDDEAPKDDASDPYFVKGVGQGTTVTPADADAIVPEAGPVEAPAADSEAPVTPAQLEPEPAPAVEGDSDLHRLMDQ